MAKVFGMHMVALKPGVKAEDFEKFVIEEVYPVAELEGVEFYLLLGSQVSAGAGRRGPRR